MPITVITSAGLAALVNAEHKGTLPVKIAKFGLGTGNYTPTAEQTALQNKFKDIEALTGGDVGDNVIHVTMNDVSSDAYTVNEVGVYLEDGTLFAVSSQPVGAILQKAAGSQGMMSIDLVVQGGSSVITIDGDTNFLNPPATTVTAGVVKLASLADIEAGIDGTKSTTPSSVFNFVKNYVTTAIDGLKKLLRAEIAASCLAAMPIGTVVHYMGDTIPEGFLLCNGASLSRTEYPELFDVIGTKCGSADSAHFSIPDMHHRFLEGTTVLSEIGKYIAEGLPNNAGGISFYNTSGATLVHPDQTGSFYGEYNSANHQTITNITEGESFSSLRMDARRSSAVYGASDTVQPNSLRALALIRVF
ncbi:tail fiber protein [uncultured Parasutterella sp.]|uniref:tail fiber protein n=2 Tax=uncultured Parasutterella sp. TaxID=1263098 RepID=UPI002711D9F9|nr:tail fiber protein [uncultured Parasutterella sp.]